MNNHSFQARDLLQMRLEHFIFHVIKTDTQGPLYLDEVALTQHQTGFFIQRFAEAARQVTEYAFNDPASSVLVQRLGDMLDNPPEMFLQTSKELATSFHSHHKGQMSDGIMAVAFATLDSIPLLLILKMDHREVLSYDLQTEGDHISARLQHVPNTVVQGRDALQKLAIIDLAGHYEWDVLAMDRSTPNQRVSQYFEQFLTMHQMETPVMLMQSAINDVHQWALAQKDQLDPEQHVLDYRERAIKYMDRHDRYETAGFLDFVVDDQDEVRSQKLKASLQSELAMSGFSDHAFEPRPELLKTHHRRHQLKTMEGVKMERVGTLEENGIQIHEPKLPGGLYEIVIRTGDMDVFT